MKYYLLLIAFCTFGFGLEGQNDQGSYLSYWKSADKAQKNGQYQKTIIYLDSLIQLNPHESLLDSALWKQTIIYYYYLQSYDKALDVAKKGVLIPMADTKFMNFIGMLESHFGQLIRSRNTLTKAKKLKEDRHEIDGQYSRILTNLGDVYIKLGDYNNGKNVLREGLKIKKKEFGERSIDYANTLYNLLKLKYTTYDFKGVLSEIDVLSDIYANSTKAKKRDQLSIQQFRGDVYFSNGKYKEALDIYESIIKERESLNLNEVSNHGLLLLSYANVLIKTDKVPLAKVELSKAYSIFNGLYGLNHFYLASIELKQAEVEGLLQPNKNVGDKFTKAINKIELSLGKYSIETANAQLSYIKYLVGIMEYSEAWKIGVELEIILKKYLKEHSLHMTDAELSNLKGAYRDFYYYIVFLAGVVPEEYNATDFSADAVLFYKNIIQNMLIKIRNDQRSSVEMSRLNDELREIEYKISINSTNKDELLNSKDSLRSILRSYYYEIKWEGIEPSWKEVSAALSSDETAIDMIEIVHSDTTWYYAHKWTSNTNKPELIKLCSKEELERLTGNLSIAPEESINLMYNFSGKRKAKPYEESPPRSLNELFWEPITKNSNIKLNKVYLSVDGLFYHINVDAIPQNIDNHVMDNVYVKRIFDLMDIVKSESIFTTNNKERKALLIGNVDYGDAAAVFKTERAEDEDFWHSLSYTGREISKISNALSGAGYKVDTITRLLATKENIKRKISDTNYDIIHFASHGAFNSSFITLNEGYDIQEEYDIMSNSSIVLSNANNDDINGYFTAYELMNQNLINSRLIVLSACSTGLGQRMTGEGVYGLQRAIRLAGAEYGIVSLWKVNDQVAKAFMNEFYNLLIVNNGDIPYSFRLTQHKMKERLIDPKHWASFILIN